MENFENRIKEKLSKARSMEGLDSEALWNVISASAFDNKKRKKRLGFFWFTLSMCAVLALVVFCFILQQSKDELNVANNELPETKMQLESNEDSTGKSDLGQDQSIKSTVSSQNSSVSDVKRLSNETGLLSEGFNPSSSFQSRGNDTAQRMPSLRPIVQESEDRFQEYSETTLVIHLAACPPTKLNIERASRPIFKGLVKEADTRKTAQNRSWHCYAGPLWAHQTYSKGPGSLSDSLNADLSSEWGSLLGGMVEIKKGQNWILQTGLEWANWKDRFDKVILSDTLLFVNQQAVMGKNIRTIRHHNSLSTLSIPIQFGMYKDRGPLRLGIQLGVSYSLILHQEGRLLKDDVTVFNYSQNQKRYDHFISFRIAPSMGYLLNERLVMNFSCFLAMQKHQSISVNGLKSKSYWIAPTIGFIYNY